ncbi:hypothetical protein ACLOJK_024986 [Asimina triloba]
MSSRKEEERYEKIIRGLMKLPPNRRSEYSDREFTHRVKSVSMAKFNSQEVDALQRGGNQAERRAREIFLKNWDTQRQRLPDSSNVDRVREFIKHVYVDRKYAGERTSDKPPRDMQSQKNHEDDIRRASSYHSYSQSPPYEHQYEDRRYGKPTGMLTRRPGSDRGHYEGKISSFIYSPGRSVEKMYEDRFANEGSVGRGSDFSASSAGDPFRSNTQSPNFQKDIGYTSPPMRPVRDILVEDARQQTTGPNTEAMARRHRNASSGSFGSFDSNSMSFKSVNSASLLDANLEPEQPTGNQEGTSALSSAQPAASVGAVSKDPFGLPFIQPVTTASSVDLFADFNKHHSSASNLEQNTSPFIQPVTTALSVDLFADFNNQHSSTSKLEQNPSAGYSAESQGWATFDLPQTATFAPETKHEQTAALPSESGEAKAKLEAFPSVNNNLEWPQVQSAQAPGPFPPVANQWQVASNDFPPVAGPSNFQYDSLRNLIELLLPWQPWNAFDDSIGSIAKASFGNFSQKSELHYPSFPPVSVDNYKNSRIPEEFNNGGVQRSPIDDLAGVTSNGVLPGSSFSQSAPPPMGGRVSQTHECKSTNPFDLPYDAEVAPNDMFLDMSSLQAALPNPQLPTAFLGGIPEPWFPQGSVTVPAAPQGQTPTSQLPRVAADEEVVRSTGEEVVEWVAPWFAGWRGGHCLCGVVLGLQAL